jgi:hypothetical protein
MINWNEIILTSVFTIMGGVIVFCTSQKNMIRGNNFFSSLNLSIKEENILKAHKELIGLANSIGPISPNEVQNTIKVIRSYENEIIKALNIRIK